MLWASCSERWGLWTQKNAICEPRLVASTMSAEVIQSAWNENNKIKYCSDFFFLNFFLFCPFLHGSVISIQHIAAFLKLTVMELMNSSSWIPKDLVFCNLIGNRVSLNKLSLSFHMSTQLYENWERLFFWFCLNFLTQSLSAQPQLWLESFVFQIFSFKEDWQ